MYYCVGDFSEQPGLDKQAVLEMESDLIEKSAEFLATSNALFDRLRGCDKPAYYLPHGIDMELFSCQVSQQHEVLDRVPAPQAGVFDLLDDRYNQALISTLSETMPDSSFEIAGSFEPPIDRPKDVENVYFVGQIDYLWLRELIFRLQILLIHYLVNSQSDALSPLKLKDCLDTGRQVAGALIKGANEMGDIVVVSHSLQEWQTAVRISMSIDIGGTRSWMVAGFAHESWESKVEEMLRICGGHGRFG